jgi:N-acetylglutamate synthase-like GNAT family acetyltransferase
MAEIDGRVIANSELKRGRGDASHIGEIGITIKDGYRNIGIGTEMLKTLISQAKTIN